VLLDFGGELLERGYVLEGVAQVGVALVEDGSFLTGLVVVAVEGLVEEGALVGWEGQIVVEQHFHDPAVVLEMGEGEGEGVGVGGVGVVDGEAACGAQEGVDERGGMEGLVFLGYGELAPEVVERGGLGGDGGDGFAAFDFVVDIVDALGEQSEGGLEGVEGGVGHAERDDIVETRHFGLRGAGQEGVEGLVDIDEGSGGGGVVGVGDGIEGSRETEGVGEVVGGLVVAEGHGDNLVGVEGKGGELLAYPRLVDRAVEELELDVEEVAIGGVGSGRLPPAVVGAEGDVGELEEAGIAGFEEVDFLLGEGVDEGDAGAERPSGVGVEVGIVAELCGGRGKGETHGGDAYDDEVDAAVAVGREEEAVEGEVSAVGTGTDECLAGDGLETVDNGGFETGV